MVILLFIVWFFVSALGVVFTVLAGASSFYRQRWPKFFCFTAGGAAIFMPVASIALAIAFTCEFQDIMSGSHDPLYLRDRIRQYYWPFATMAFLTTVALALWANGRKPAQSSRDSANPPRGCRVIYLALALAWIAICLTWLPLARDPYEWRVTLRGVHLSTRGQRGWAVGLGKKIIATRDGGLHWDQQMNLGGEGSLSTVTFASDGQSGWAAGPVGTIFATRDGGLKWEAQTCPVSEDLYSVTFADDARRGWIVGRRGTILMTRDGGTHWTSAFGPVTADLRAVAFAGDGERGWIVGFTGTILATRDGGGQWVKQTSPVDENLLSVTVATDGLRGWIVGYEGTVLFTENGGVSWELQDHPTTGNLHAVSFAPDGRHGVAVGDEKIIATQDGGANWRWGSVPHRRSLSAVSLASDGKHALAVGETIFATQDGGASWFDPRDYPWEPPWIFYLSLLLTAAPLYFAFRRQRHEVPSTEDTFIS